VLWLVGCPLVCGHWWVSPTFRSHVTWNYMLYCCRLRAVRLQFKRSRGVTCAKMVTLKSVNDNQDSQDSAACMQQTISQTNSNAFYREIRGRTVDSGHHHVTPCHITDTQVRSALVQTQLCAWWRPSSDADWRTKITIFYYEFYQRCMHSTPINIFISELYLLGGILSELGDLAE